MRLRPAVFILLAAAACSRRDGLVSYRDPDGLFSVEVPGLWRVLGADGARRAAFFAPDSSSITVLFYAKGSAQESDPYAFAVAHRGSGKPLGPIQETAAAGGKVLRYALRLEERGGGVREETAVLAEDKGLLVVLGDAPEPNAAAALPGFERFLSSLKP